MTDDKTAIKLFEEQNVRVQWDNEQEKWWFSIIDVIRILTQSSEPRRYWSDLKRKLAQEAGNIQLYEKIVQLKLSGNDGKKYATDVADTETLLRIIQSIPSPKAEPFKLWLARVGRERIDELEDPEITINRALETYLKKGYSESWINQRLKSIEVRKALTDEWDKGGIQKGQEYAILTDEITKAWSGMSTKEYKRLKGLKKENLRDNMSNMELILNMLAEATTTEIAKGTKPYGIEQHKKVARRGGEIAGRTRSEIEKQSGRPVITGANAEQLQLAEEKSDPENKI